MSLNDKEKLDRILDFCENDPDILFQEIFMKSINRGSLFQHGKREIFKICVTHKKNDAIALIKKHYGIGGGTVNNVLISDGLRLCTHDNHDSKGIQINVSLYSKDDDIKAYFYNRLGFNYDNDIEFGIDKLYTWNQVFEEITEHIKEGNYLDFDYMQSICDELNIENPFITHEPIMVQMSLFDLIDDMQEKKRRPSLDDVLKQIEQLHKTSLVSESKEYERG